MKLTKRWRQSKSASCIAMIVAATAVVASAADEEPRRIQAGSLTCSLSASIGLIVGSQRNVSCLFRGAPGEPDEPYTGTMTRVGLDVGVTAGSVIIWAVFADTNRYKGMLTGTYIGASAEMSIAAGLGANVLVGGSNRTVVLLASVDALFADLSPWSAPTQVKTCPNLYGDMRLADLIFQLVLDEIGCNSAHLVVGEYDRGCNSTRLVVDE